MKSKQRKTKSTRRQRTLDLVEMRSWRGKRSITRAVVLLTSVNRILGEVEFTAWLEKPNPILNGESPNDLVAAGKWDIMADAVEDMLTGAPL